MDKETPKSQIRILGWSRHLSAQSDLAIWKPCLQVLSKDFYLMKKESTSWRISVFRIPYERKCCHRNCYRTSQINGPCNCGFSGERERERERAKRAINFPTCHDQPNINFWRISHSFKEIARFFMATEAAFVWVKCRAVWKVALDWRIILRWIFRKLGVGVWTGSNRLGIGTCECGNETSGSIKCG